MLITFTNTRIKKLFVTLIVAWYDRYVYELSSKRQKPTMISCLLGVHAWLVLTTHEIMFLPHCLKLNMQMMKDDAHNLVPRMHVSEISPPKMILNQRELLGYLYAKVSG